MRRQLPIAAEKRAGLIATGPAIVRGAPCAVHGEVCARAGERAALCVPRGAGQHVAGHSRAQVREVAHRYSGTVVRRMCLCSLAEGLLAVIAGAVVTLARRPEHASPTPGRPSHANRLVPTAPIHL